MARKVLESRHDEEGGFSWICLPRPDGSDLHVNILVAMYTQSSILFFHLAFKQET